jgi:uncharacterized protein with FMN-binding domain
MRRVIVAVTLTVAGLIPVLWYEPTPVKPVTSQAALPSGPSVSGQQTVDGATVDTQFGPYQVRAVFAGGKIVDVQLITEPGDRHSQRIAGQAAPVLLQEVLQAQSAHVDTVSGATATSEAYVQSLQAAIDAKGH